MTVWTAIFWLLGAAGVLFLLCLGVVFWENRWPGRRYDERQQAARGRGYGFAYWIGFVYFLGAMIYLLTCKDRANACIPAMAYGLLVELLAVHFYCLLTHAALPLSQSPLVMAGGYVFIGGSQLYSFLRLLRQGAQVPADQRAEGEGMLWVLLAFAVASFLIAATHMIAWLRRPKDDG